MTKDQKDYLTGVAIILIGGLLIFFVLNMLPIPYHFKILEVFGLVFLSILLTVGVRPNILNKN